MKIRQGGAGGHDEAKGGYTFVTLPRTVTP